jgi:hypothetical protein
MKPGLGASTDGHEDESPLLHALGLDADFSNGLRALRVRNWVAIFGSWFIYFKIKPCKENTFFLENIIWLNFFHSTTICRLLETSKICVCISN